MHHVHIECAEAGSPFDYKTTDERPQKTPHTARSALNGLMLCSDGFADVSCISRTVESGPEASAVEDTSTMGVERAEAGSGSGASR
mmetsp:Transcript_18730/g.51649  ORF Transcript_18730/g.51649 Transcript_18730/m.51649 type:complete len:86 (-) Transcript_18730:30-287(-)